MISREKCKCKSCKLYGRRYVVKLLNAIVLLLLFHYYCSIIIIIISINFIFIVRFISLYEIVVEKKIIFMY